MRHRSPVHLVDPFLLSCFSLHVIHLLLTVLAKFADVFARSWTYAFSLTAYVVGFILIAFAPTLTAYIIGSVLVAIGGAAITLLNSVLCADLIPLQYRGLAQGILSTPYLATSWYTSEIANALGTNHDCELNYLITVICKDSLTDFVRNLVRALGVSW